VQDVEKLGSLMALALVLQTTAVALVPEMTEVDRAHAATTAAAAVRETVAWVTAPRVVVARVVAVARVVVARVVAAPRVVAQVVSASRVVMARVAAAPRVGVARVVAAPRVVVARVAAAPLVVAQVVSASRVVVARVAAARVRVAAAATNTEITEGSTDVAGARTIAVVLGVTAMPMQMAQTEYAPREAAKMAVVAVEERGAKLGSMKQWPTQH
jgi:hypothetical protein